MGIITLATLKRVARVLKEDVDEELLVSMLLEANGGQGVGKGVERDEFEDVMRRAGMWRWRMGECVNLTYDDRFWALGTRGVSGHNLLTAFLAWNFGIGSKLPWRSYINGRNRSLAKHWFVHIFHLFSWFLLVRTPTGLYKIRSNLTKTPFHLVDNLHYLTLNNIFVTPISL